MATRRHGARWFWPDDTVLYPAGTADFISRAGDGEFDYLYVDGDGNYLDVYPLPENLVRHNGEPVIHNGEYVIHTP